MNDFSLLNNRKIIDILIGDIKLFEQYGLPYMSGQIYVNFVLLLDFPKHIHGVE